MNRLRAEGRDIIGLGVGEPDFDTPVHIAEAGVAGYEAGSWYGVLVPAATPRPVVQKIAGDVRRITRDADTVRKFRELDLTPVGSTPEELVRVVREDTERWRQVGRVANIRMD